MGANQILKYAGEQGDNSVVDAFCALCTPFDIVACSRYLLRGSPQHYIPDSFLVKNMVSVIKTNEKILKEQLGHLNLNFEKIYNSKTSHEFDSLYTCKLLGYETPEHYYAESSCAKHLHNIQRPTLAISAADDPVVTTECIPFEEFEKNKNLVLLLTKRGGHVGWFTGIRPRRVKSI